jgi:hypothetical protein
VISHCQTYQWRRCLPALILSAQTVGWIPGQDLFHADAYDQVLIDLREGME